MSDIFTKSGRYASYYFQSTINLGNGIIIGIADNIIYRSTDYGENWTAVYTGTSGLTGGDRIVTDGSGNVYATIFKMSAASYPSELLYSNDYGATWSNRQFAWYGMTSLLLIGSDLYTLKCCFTNVTGGQHDCYLMKSIDNGVSFNSIYTFDSNASDFYTKTYRSFIHCDNGTILFSMRDIKTGYNWLFKSDDYGQTFTKYTSLNSSSTQNYAMLTYLGNGIVVSGTNAKIYRSTDYGASFSLAYTYTSATWSISAIGIISGSMFIFSVGLGSSNQDVVFSLDGGITYFAFTADSVNSWIFGTFYSGYPRYPSNYYCNADGENKILYYQMDQETGSTVIGINKLTLSLPAIENTYNSLIDIDSVTSIPDVNYNISISLLSVKAIPAKYFNTLVSLKSGTMHIYSFNSIIKVKNNYTYIPVSANIKETYYIPVKGQILPETNFNSLPFEV